MGGMYENAYLRRIMSRRARRGAQGDDSEIMSQQPGLITYTASVQAAFQIKED